MPSRSCWTGTSGRSRSGAARTSRPCMRACGGRCPSRSRRWPWPATGCGPCSSRPGPRSRSRRGRGPGRWRCGAGNRRGTRGPSGARGRPWLSPYCGSPNRAGSGPSVADTGPGPVPGGPASAGSRSSPRPEVTAKSLMPRSIPTTAPVGGELLRVGDLDGEGDVPAPARVTGDRHRGRVDRAGSMPGQDQMNASGVSIFARNSAPSRYRNPDRVYSADWRPVRDLNPGSGPAWRRNW